MDLRVPLVADGSEVCSEASRLIFIDLNRVAMGDIATNGAHIALTRSTFLCWGCGQISQDGVS
jgi:hypothetical protein